VTFKIIFAENNIRRLKLSFIPSFDEFIALLKSNYPSLFCGDKKFLIKYLDSDNDKIAVSTQIEWEELISQLLGNDALKIFVEEKNVEEKNVEEKNIEEENEREQIPVGGSVPVGDFDVQDFFQAFENVVREIPMMTENFWQQCMDWEEKNRVFWNLHRFSLSCLDSLDKNVVQKGKEAILKMIEIVPDHAMALYNLACAESLLGNAKEAVATLEKAIEAGYHDLTHLINDTDFDNIKNTLGFNEVIAKLQRIINPETTQNNLDSELVDLSNGDKCEPKIEETKSPEEQKLDTLTEIFALPRDVLKELLDECKGDMQGVVDLISSQFI